MSTKIYHGYQIQIQTCRELWDWRKQIIAQFEADAEVRLANQTAKDAVKLADNLRILPQWGVPVPPMKTEWGYETNVLHTTIGWLEKELKESKTHCLRDHFELDITLLEANGLTLALLHHNSPIVEAWFKKQAQVKHFPYWDNTDQPKEISAKEWNQRGQIWDKALIGLTPETSGLSMKSQDPTNFLWDIHKKFSLVPPTKKERAQRLARIIFEHKTFSGLQKEMKSCRISTIMEISQKLKQHPGRPAIERIIQRELRDYRRWEDLKKIPTKTIKNKPNC